MSVGRGCKHCDVREVFLGSEALEQGKLTEYDLRRWHRAIFRDVFVRKGLPVTTPARTAYDLGRHLPRGQALARMDP